MRNLSNKSTSWRISSMLWSFLRESVWESWQRKCCSWNVTSDHCGTRTVTTIINMWTAVDKSWPLTREISRLKNRFHRSTVKESKNSTISTQTWSRETIIDFLVDLLFLCDRHYIRQKEARKIIILWKESKISIIFSKKIKIIIIHLRKKSWIIVNFNNIKMIKWLLLNTRR